MNYFLRVVLPAVIAIVIGIVLERILTVSISRYGKKRGLSESHIHLIKLVMRWAIIIILIVVVASIFGLGVGNLWATLAGLLAMVIVGFFAIRSILSNLLATIIILLARPFNIRDRVTILPENLSGEATDINLMYSILKKDDGEIMTVPNITFLTKFISVAPQKPQ